MLFQDDSKMKHWTAALKEKKLLFNFFKRLRFNETGRYETEFKYISLCGRERNFVRCDDRPIVFHSGEGQRLANKNRFFLWKDKFLKFFNILYSEF